MPLSFFVILKGYGFYSPMQLVAPSAVRIADAIDTMT